MAELELNERQAGDVTILDMSGSVRMGEGAISLRNSIRGLNDEGKKKILLNLAAVKNIDSSGSCAVRAASWRRSASREARHRS